MTRSPLQPIGEEQPVTDDAAPRSTGRKILYFLILLLTLACATEVGLRVAYRIVRGSWNFAGSFDAQQRLYTPHPYNAYSLAPNVTLDTHIGTVHTSPWGTRGPEHSYEKPPGVIRIVTLGGSTTFCVYASDDGKTWPAQLEAVLNERLAPRRFEVINYGAAGYNSADSLATFALRAIDRDPDIVIVLHAWNDISLAIKPGLVSDYTHHRDVASHHQRGWWFQLAIARTLWLVRGKLARAHLTPAGTAEDIDPRAVELYERNVESIVLLAQPRGIETVLVTFATRLPPDNDPDWRSRIDQVKFMPLRHHFTPAGVFHAVTAYNQALRRIAQRRGATLVDLANTYPRDVKYFADFAHKTDQGLRLFAEMLADQLIEQGVIDRVLDGPQKPAAAGSD
ncbi:MAG: SGNH/GDSL hydrolase family protein [Phycisphaerales bacterium]|nr:MAG: SGNH/GDSL hydrolase family protein [Phycisphaerales bacterium]